MAKSLIKENYIYIFGFFSILCYYLIGYQINRLETSLLFTIYTLLFLSFVVFMNKKISINSILILGISFRLILIGSIPDLSQDYFRFIWDGNLSRLGLNPYMYTPIYLSKYDQLFPLANNLILGMGELSANNYSNYPPFSQLVYLISSQLGKNNLWVSILTIRLIIIAFEFATFILMCKLANSLNTNAKKVGWYFLNPLIIIELTGNLHGEGLMIFFFILGLAYFNNNKIILSAIAISFSAATKLITLIIAPVLFKKLSFNKSILFFSLITLIFLSTWIPYIKDEFYFNYLTTINLWFNRFDFNGSIYYLIREVGYYCKGYNIIREYGKIIPLLIFCLIFYFAFLTKNKDLKSIIANQLILLSLYFFISTTVHPWYIITLVALSVFTTYYYPIVWSGLIFISYSAYSIESFNEKPIYLWIEYVLVYSAFFYEIYRRKNYTFKPSLKT